MTVDAIVIGAGVIGSAVAYELALQGSRVLVVDKGAGVGQGSTGASSAVVRYHYSTFDGVALAWESRACWAEWPEHLGAPRQTDLAALCHTGVVILDAPITPRARMRELFEQVGVPYEEWDSQTLRGRVPGLDPGRFWPPKRIDDEAFWTDATDQLGAVFTPDGGFIDDPMLATQNLAGAASRLGVRFRLKAAVSEVRTAHGRVAGISLANGERIDAPIVVNCAGPWSGRINALAQVESDFTIETRPMRQEVHQVPAPPGYNADDRLGPVISDPDLGIYVRAIPGDAMMIGGTEPECDDPDWLDDADAFNPNRTAKLFEVQVARAARRFPGLSITQPKGIAGVYDVASDWTPIYDRTELDGFYVAMGTSGNQFKNAPVVGRIMAALIEAVENGHDHDGVPVRYQCQHTSHVVNLGAFSRKRERNPHSSGTVRG